MRSIVTGGAGFIGSHLCDYLLSKGHEVICIDNLVTGDIKNISHLLNIDKFSFIKHDITTTESIYFDGDIDFIYHFASPASPKDYLNLPIETLTAGSIGLYNIIKLAKEYNSRFLLASTSEVYGDPIVNPQNEEYFGNVNPIGPRSVYDEAKRFSEAMTMAFHRYFNLDSRIARIFNTYGERMRNKDGRVIPNFITQALKGEDITIYGDGSQTRSFCYINDEIEGIYKLMMSDYNFPINIGNPDEYTILELSKIIKNLTNSNSKIIFKDLPINDPKQRKPDITKAKKILKWEPKISLDQGLESTIKYFKNTEI